jgi:hypothetical protein
MGVLLDAQDCFRRMLARVHALQNWGSNTFTEAELLARIYIDVAPEPENGDSHTVEELNELRPFIVVGISANNAIGLKRYAMGGGGGSFTPFGSLIFFVEQNAVGDTEAEVDREFATVLDSMLFTGDRDQPGIVDLTGDSDTLAIKQIVCDGIYRIEPDEVASKGDSLRAYFRVDWGID